MLCCLQKCLHSFVLVYVMLHWAVAWPADLHGGCVQVLEEHVKVFEMNNDIIRAFSSPHTAHLGGSAAHSCHQRSYSEPARPSLHYS